MHQTFGVIYQSIQKQYLLTDVQKQIRQDKIRQSSRPLQPIQKQIDTTLYLPLNLYEQYSIIMITRFNPNQYIKNREQYADYQCKICYELTDAPMRCRGPCHGAFCQHCITFTKNAADKCPLRCSEIFLVEPIPHLQFQYQCPFNKEQCKVTIRRVVDFHNHYRQCSFVPTECLEQISKKKGFICDNGHKLQVITKFLYEKVFEGGQFENVYRLKCVSCNEEGVCPTICLQCTRKDKQAVYCINCRTIPCGKYKCPLGHMWLGKSVDGYIGLKNSQICHMCGVSPGIVGKVAYFDSLCGFRLCQVCHVSLPYENELIPLKHGIYELQQSRFDFCLSEFKRDQQLARQQLQAEIQREQSQPQEDMQSSENSHDSYQMEMIQRMQRMIRFQRRKRRHHSSSQSSQSEDEELRYKLHQEISGVQNEQNVMESNSIVSHIQPLLQEHHLQQENEEDQFFSIESEPERFKCQQLQDRYFQCESGENTTPEHSLSSRLQDYHSNPSA